MSWLRVQEALAVVRSRMLGSVLMRATLGNLLLVLACGGEVTENSQGSGGNEPTCASVEADGSTLQYVLSVASPALVLYPWFSFDATLSANTDEMCMVIQPLAAADRTTPVGSPEYGGPYPLDETGRFVAHYVLVIPKEADAAYGADRDIPADFQLEAKAPTCGSVTGCSYPAGTLCHALDGSTFALTPLSDPDAHTRPIIDCAGTRADPL